MHAFACVYVDVCVCTKVTLGLILMAASSSITSLTLWRLALLDTTLVVDLEMPSFSCANESVGVVVGLEVGSEGPPPIKSVTSLLMSSLSLAKVSTLAGVRVTCTAGKQ